MRNEFLNLVNELNSMFYVNNSYRSFPVDVIKVESGYEVVGELPGVNKEDISITFEDGLLTIEAETKRNVDKKYIISERNSMKFKRSITFEDINEDTFKAKYENGLLTISIMVKEPEKKEKKSII
ncbi:MAG: Hsp20 family protein, partial [Acholeplasmatales bacterium]|nr:Hsp20 family protein [Acholeplasmatales bacterium]